MPWIKPVKQQNLKEYKIYEELEKPVPIFNRMVAHSPDILEAFIPLQNAVKNTFLSDDYREAIITYVSIKNGCEFCTKSHATVLGELIGESEVVKKLTNYQSEDWDEKLKSILNYAEKLTSKPVSVTKEDITQMQSHGYREKEIFEINQVVAYTTYTNQMSVGLGL
ncbi:peroxidase-related enzyme [Pontibacillus sp. HMF3514]|uniref:peroxidase-related enzyme n=1 Tax=Pontibacillus sp. HMF3514 TaxID=2692425 RepID=UPI00131F99A8|nr:peroxidase-related enzyme [Pontibacillus sp. HMF3514]QHE52988.1 peroxidase-related enzyme [Pontibacillus sp. HMF3514]